MNYQRFRPSLNRVARLGASALALASALLSSTGCVMWMREPEFYATELTELLEDHEAAIEACYERELERDPKLAGKLVVGFEVERKTGALTNVMVDAAQTTAPDPLAACVTDQLGGLVFEPADVNTASATYTWEFAPGSRKRPPADPFAGAREAVLACYADHLATVDRTATGALVIDYAFNRASGAVDRLEVVGEATTAPQPVVVCATTALKAVQLDPSELEDRNVAGRRSFTLRFEPWAASGA